MSVDRAQVNTRPSAFKFKSPSTLELDIFKLVQVGMLGKAINILVFGGNMPRDIAADIKEFRDKKRRGNIDIWWLFDDGGMPVLLGHILQSRMQFAECKLRIFTLGSEKLENQNSMFRYQQQLLLHRLNHLDFYQIISRLDCRH